MTEPRDKNTESTDALATCARRYPSHPALMSSNGTLSYSDLDREVSLSAGRLRVLGAAPGDRVVLAAPNSATWVKVAHACLRAGITVCPLDPGLAAPELRERIALLAPRLVIATERVLGSIDLPSEITQVVIDGEEGGRTGAVSHWEDIRPAPGLAAGVVPNCIAAILMTSGSSGRPKGVVLTSRNLESGAECQMAHFGETPANPRWLVNLPLYHIGGFIVLFRALAQGGAIIVQRGFDPAGTLEAVVQLQATHLSLVPTTLRRLLEASGNGNFPGSVRVALIGGGPCGKALLEEAWLAGIPACPTYGMTEASSQIATWRPEDPRSMLGQSAPIVPGLRAEVRDESGQKVEIGDEGQIWISGLMVAANYWDGPGHLSAALQDGWLPTGDLGLLHEGGFLQVLGRRDDVIISGGRKIHPEEVEQALLRISGIDRAVVVGEDDPSWGQALVAIIQTAGSINEAEIVASLRPQLAAFKIPKRFVPLKEWPGRALGKARRRDFLGLLQGK